jgi:hypothetical protein
VIEYLPSKHKALSLKPSTTKKEKRKKFCNLHPQKPSETNQVSFSNEGRR